MVRLTDGGLAKQKKIDIHISTVNFRRQGFEVISRAKTIIELRNVRDPVSMVGITIC